VIDPALVVLAAAVAAALWLARPAPASAARGRPALTTGGLVVAAAVPLALVVPPVLPVVGVVVALGGRELWRARSRRRGAERTAAGVLEACELVAVEVAAGQPPGAALRHACGAWPPLRDAAEAAELGGDVPATLRRLAQQPGAGQLRLVAAGWQVAHRSGGGLADALGRVATSLRADRSTRRVVGGELASARATARLVAALPGFAMLVSASSGGGAWAFVVGNPLGWACLLLGLVLGLAGLWWIERIAAGVLA
jgi:tight adherence protein B